MVGGRVLAIKGCCFLHCSFLPSSFWRKVWSSGEEVTVKFHEFFFFFPSSCYCFSTLKEHLSLLAEQVWTGYRD